MVIKKISPKLYFIYYVRSMRGSRTFRQWGGGPGQSDKKSTDVFCFVLFFLVLRSNIFQGGGPTFSRVGPIAYSLL